MDKELEKLIEDFNIAFKDTYEKRFKILDYLEDNYEIDTYGYTQYIDDDKRRISGMDIEHIETLIKRSKENNKNKNKKKKF